MLASRALDGAWAIAVVAFVLYTGTVLLSLVGDPIPQAVTDWTYVGLIAFAGIAIAMRGLLRATDRLAWVVIGAGVAIWAAGEAAWVVDPNLPVPSFVDGFYLAYYPLAYLGIVLLVRARAANAGPQLWLDGAITLLGSAALGSAIVVREVAAVTGGTVAEIAVSLAYPVADMILLGLVLSAISLGPWRREAFWCVLAAGLLVDCIANAIYSYQVATGGYVDGTALDLLWPLSTLLVLHACQRSPDAAVVRRELAQAPVMIGLAGVSGLMILAIGSLGRLDPWTAAFATTTLLGALARLTMTLRENRRMLRSARVAATTDSLTALGNRRKVMDRLDCLAAADGRQALILFDLDGFKQYNDAFGHIAGDALLARLGRRLQQAAKPFGEAFRLGGDEFCVLASIGADDGEPAAVLAATSAALAATGDGFAVEGSAGIVVMPDEARDAVQALQLADRRMYADKNAKPRRRSDAYRTLVAVLAEGEPGVWAHARDVAELACDTGARLGVQGSAFVELRRAAELHDIGKIAIPDAILHKAGPLDDDEWTFMRDHTIIGERLLAAAGELSGVARIVRASHERWQGGGYPDGLSGEAIPLAARIVAVCDAFNAMTSDRPYSRPLEVEQALAELRRSAGSQFDPIVVDAFLAVHAERGDQRQAA